MTVPRLRIATGWIVTGCIATLAVLASARWAAGSGATLLVATAALGLAFRLPPRATVYTALIVLLASVPALLVRVEDVAAILGNAAYFVVVLGCLWALWDLACDRLSVPMPLHDAASGVWCRARPLVRARERGRPRGSTERRAVDSVIGWFCHDDAVLGVACGLVLSLGIWGGGIAPLLHQHVPPFRSPRPARYSAQVATVAQTIVCDSEPEPRYYEALKVHRLDILEYYVWSPWTPGLSCEQIYDTWLQSGQDFPSTTVQEYVTKQGWLEAPRPLATATSVSFGPQVVATAQALSCTGGPAPQYYEVLKQHRLDVLEYYVAQPWRSGLTCRQIYDDWLASGTEFPPTTARDYVAEQGWLPPIPSVTSVAE